MANNPFAPPAPPNQLMGGTPAPNVQPMGQPQGVGATAGRRKGFSDFLETTISPPPPSSGGGVQTQAQTAPVVSGGPPMGGGMNIPPQAGGMMGRPPAPPMGGRPPMGGPMGPPMGGPIPPAMNRGLGGMPQKPMMQRPPQPKGPPRRMAGGGHVHMEPISSGLGVFLDGEKQENMPNIYQEMLRSGVPRDEIFSRLEQMRDSAMHVAEDADKFLQTPYGDFTHTHDEYTASKASGFAEGGSVPRQTMIGGQPHMLAYINPEEEDLLQEYRDDSPVFSGPGDIPTYLFHNQESRDRNKAKFDKVVSSVKDTVSSIFGGGNVNTSAKDADMGVGAINTGKTYSGDDPIVSGGFDFGDDDNNTSSTTTTTTSYGSSSEVTPFTDPVVQQVKYDSNTGTYSYGGQSGLSGDQLTAALSGGIGVDTGVPGIDTSYNTGGSGSLVTGGASDSNKDFFDSVNTGSNWDSDGSNTGGVKDDSDKNYVTVSSDETTTYTPTPEPEQKYYDAFGNEYSSQAAATAADNAAAEAAAQAERDRKARERERRRREAEAAAAAAEAERLRLQKIEDDRLARNRNLVLGGGSLVTGEASTANQDFFNAVNQGSNFSDSNSPLNITNITNVRSDNQPSEDNTSLAEQMKLYGQGQTGNQYISQVAKNYRDLGYSPEEASRLASEAYITAMNKVDAYSKEANTLDDSERTRTLSDEERNQLLSMGYNEDMLNLMEFDLAAYDNPEDPLDLLRQTDRPNVTEADKKFNYQGDSNFIYDGDDNVDYGKNATKNKTPFEGIIFHHTGNDYPAANQSKYGKNYDEERGGYFGYHFVIDKDGTIIQSAPLDKRTNHLKSSDMRDEYSNFSSANTIGISLVGSVDGEMTDAQMRAAQQLATQLGDNFNIGNENMLGQSTVQAGKQADEGKRLEEFFSTKDTSSADMADYAFPNFDDDETSSEPVIPDSDQDTDTTDTTAWYFGTDYEGELGGGEPDQDGRAQPESDQEEGKITTPGGTSVDQDTDTDDPEKQGLGNISAADKKANLAKYQPLIDEIEKARNPNFFEGLMQKFLGAAIGISPAGMIGRALYDDLLNKTQEERDAIIDEHIQAIADGNQPVVDKDGNYIGYTNMATEDAWESFLPPTNKEEMEARSDLNGNGIPDYDEFKNRFDKQSIAADNDPYGMTTATGFIVDEFFEADMDGDGVMEGYIPGVEYTVNNDGTVVRAGSEGDTTGGLSFLGESLVNQELIDPPDDGDEVGPSGLPEGDLKDPFVPFEPDPEPETPVIIPETPKEDDPIVDDEKNFTIGDDGLPVCNDEGYVYSEELDMCVPMEEEGTGTDTTLTSTFRGRGSGDRPGKRAPRLTRTIGGQDTPEARALGFANGGSVGLNAAADRFLRAMQGAR